MKGKSSALTAIFALMGIAVIFGVFLYAAGQLGWIDTGTSQSTVREITREIVTQPGISQPTTTSLCSGINTLSLNVAVRNPLNTSSDYNSQGLRIIPAGNDKVTATGTSTSATTLTYLTVSVPCDSSAFSGRVNAMSDTTTFNSAVADYAITGTAGSVIMEATKGDELQITPYNTTGSVTTKIAMATLDEQSPTINDTVQDSGSTFTGELHVKGGNILFTQFGGNVRLSDVPALQPYINFDPGALWIYDSVDAAAFSDNSLTLSHPTLIEIPMGACTEAFSKSVSVNSANRCWITSPIKTTSPVKIISYTLTGDGGSAPGTTSDPTLDIADIQYVEQVGSLAGRIVVETLDNAGTDVGQGNSVVTWDND